MKSLHSSTGNFRVDALLNKPFTYSRDYVNMPNYVRSIPWLVDENRNMDKTMFWVLGDKKPVKKDVRSRYPQAPKLYVHEFANVLFYKGLPFDDNGNLIYDAIRRCMPNGEVAGFLTAAKYRPQKLVSYNKNYFIFKRQNKVNITIDRSNETLYFADTLDNFGHRILDTVPCMYVNEIFDNGKMLFYKTHKPYVDTLLNPLNVKHYSVNHEATFFPKMYIPTRAYMNLCYVSKAATTIWKKIRDFYNKDNTVRNQKIYLSRSHFGRRALLNEEECEKVFAQAGFTIVHPQDLSLEEQIRLVSSASHLAGPAGSNMHHQVFASDRAQCLFLCPQDWRHSKVFPWIETALGRTGHVVYGTMEKKQPGMSDDAVPWRMDIKKLQRALEQWISG